MAQNRFYSSVAFPTFLTSSVGSSGNPLVASIAGLPTSYPFTVLLDWGLSTQEAISVLSAPTGGGPYTLPCTRGIDGTTAQAHSQNAVAVHGVTAQDYNEPQVHISTGVSGASYPNVIHGLANTSAVVGTIDTQTLTNKTLGATTVTGDVSISVNEAAGPILGVTNTHSAPTAAITRVTANAAADSAKSIRVSGDTVDRWLVDSNGKTNWGPGNAATDTDLYRQGVGVLTSDNTITALLGAQVGASAPSFGAGTGGIVGITNATAAPSAASIASGIALYSQAGLLRYMNTNGLTQVITGSQLGGTVVYANSTTETAMSTLTVPANDPILGAVYYMSGMGVVSTTGSPTVIWKTRWGGTAGTSLATTAAITQGTGVTTLPFFFQIQVMFTSTTAAMASMNIGYFTAAGTVPTINYQQSTAPITVTTNSSQALVFTATWSAASASNTMTSWYSSERIS